MSIRIINEIWQAGPDRATDRFLLIAIASACHNERGDRTARRSLDWLERRTGFKRNTITESIKRLTEGGWIEVKRGGRGLPNRYNIRPI